MNGYRAKPEATMEGGADMTGRYTRIWPEKRSFYFALRATLFALIVPAWGCVEQEMPGQEPLEGDLIIAENWEDSTNEVPGAGGLPADVHTATPREDACMEADDTEVVEPAVVLSPAVVLMDDESGLTLVTNEADGLLVLETDGTTKLAKGDILLADVEHGAILARVVSVTPDGPNLNIETEIPALDEVFEQAEISVELPVDFSTAKFEGLVADSVELLSASKADEFGLPEMYVPFSGLVIMGVSTENEWGDAVEILVKVKSGHFKLQPTLHFEFDIGLFSGLERFLIALETEVTFLFELEASVTGSLDMFTYESQPFLKIPPISAKFLIGAVPGWVDFSADFKWYVNLDLEGSVQATTGIDAFFSSTIGAEYEDGEWHVIAAKDSSLDGLGPELEAPGGVGIRVGPKCEFYVKPYSIMGPSLYLTPYFKLLASLKASPLGLAWELLFGLEAGVEFDVEFKKWHLKKFTKKIFDWATTIAQGFIPVDCVQDCSGLECGPDHECGKSCGQCPSGFECDDGVCECVPDCQAKDCGPDGCGGQCGKCPDGYQCYGNVCGCFPDCDGVDCGPDGCGGSCGKCPKAQDLCIEGECVCIPDCAGKQCGPDGCGGECALCPDGFGCANSQCQPGPCVADCAGKECGPDGCGKLCGDCDGGAECVAGDCVCVAKAEANCCLSEPDAICFFDSCGNEGNVIADCPYGCEGGKCVGCNPDCSDLDCGPDPNCGESCGKCYGEYECNLDSGQCEKATCVPQCGPLDCGPDGCDGTCGPCPNGMDCDNGTCKSCNECSEDDNDYCESNSKAFSCELSADGCWKWEQGSCKGQRVCCQGDCDFTKPKCSWDGTMAKCVNHQRNVAVSGWGAWGTCEKFMKAKGCCGTECCN